MSDAILVPNAGSSSPKYSAFAAGGGLGSDADHERALGMVWQTLPVHQPRDTSLILAGASGTGCYRGRRR